MTIMTATRSSTPKTISAAEAAALVSSGMWLDYGALPVPAGCVRQALGRARDELKRRQDPLLPHHAAARGARGRSRGRALLLVQLAFLRLRPAQARCRPLQLHAAESRRDPRLLPPLHRAGRHRRAQDARRWTRTAISTSARPISGTAPSSSAPAGDRRGDRRACPTSTASDNGVHVSEVDYIIEGDNEPAAGTAQPAANRDRPRGRPR